MGVHSSENIDKLKRRITEIEARKAACYEEFDDDIANEADIDDFAAKIYAFDEEIYNLDNLIEEAEVAESEVSGSDTVHSLSELEKLKEERTAAEKCRDELQEEVIPWVQKDLQDAENELQDVENEIKRLHDRLKTLQNERDESQKQLQGLQKELQTADNEIKQLDNLIEAKLAQVHTPGGK